ncbi:MAG TPA: hypothetical protein VH088_09910 [Terriglobales bacterium]|nr:hypothetical protein [Terriglobales bacterium]
MSTIRFSPDEKLTRKMPSEERQRTAALLDVHTESETDDAVRFVIDVGFRSVPVKRPWVDGHWFVACRSALISLEIDDGTILDHTGETSIQFHYKLNSSSDTELGGKFEPTVKVGPEGAETEFSIVSLTAKKRDKDGGQLDYDGKEDELGVSAFANSVTWDYSIVRGKRAIRDFLFCDLPLRADCKPKFKRLRGSIELMPSIFYFDRDKQQMSGMSSFLMQLTLAFRKKDQASPIKSPVLNQEGIHLTFGESR